MNDIVLHDHRDFDRFVEGKDIAATVTLMRDELVHFEPGNRIHVWYRNNAPDSPSYPAEVLENLGLADAFVFEEPHTFSFRIRRVREGEES